VWVDTHCHVYDEKMGVAADGAVGAAHGAGVSALIVIGTDARTSAAAVELAARHASVWATVGLHPHDATDGVGTVAPLIDSPRVVAVGECGLDYHYDHSPRDVQRIAFAEQIALAKAHGLSLVIHTREAWDDTFDVLDAEGMPERTVFHCFTGGIDEAKRCVERGAFLSFSGIVTFPTANDVREAAAWCPADRIVVETDAPFLAPVPYRGKPNSPARVAEVGRFVAALRGEDEPDFARRTTANACLAFPGIAP
jgi:TatD DNase family protein